MSTGKHLFTFQIIIIMPMLDHGDGIHYVHNINTNLSHSVFIC